MTTSGAGAGDDQSKSGALRTHDTFNSAARVAFGIALILSPFRARFELTERLDPPVYRDFTSFIVYWFELAALATLILWALSLWRRQRRVSTGPAVMRWASGSLIAWSWLSSISSADPLLSLYASARLTFYLGLGLFALNEIRNYRSLWFPALLTILFQVIVAVPQAVTADFIGLTWLGEHDLDPNAVSTSQVVTSSGAQQIRAYGLADHPNILGGLLTFAIVVVATAATGQQNRLGRITTLAVVILGAIGVLLTFSRSAGAGLIAAIAIGVLLNYSQGQWYDLRRLVVATGITLLMLLAPVAIYWDFVSTRSNVLLFDTVDSEHQSLEARWILMKTGVDLIARDPLLGTGIGASPTAIRDAYVGFRYDPQPPHVAVLASAAEVGIVGGAAYAVLVIAPLFLLRSVSGAIRRPLIGATCLVGAVTVVGLFDYHTWSYPAGLLWFWLAVGSWCGAYEDSRSAGIRKGYEAARITGPVPGHPPIAQRPGRTSTGRKLWTKFGST